MDLIVIPSSKRAKSQKTLACFERTQLTKSYRVVLAVPEAEVGKYEHASWKGKYIKRHTMESIGIEGVPVKGIGATREYILLKIARKYKARTVMMVDDDLSFCHRPDKDKPDMPYINDDPYHMHLMVETLTEWLTDGIAHVGLISRQANRKIGTHWQEPGRMMNAYAYDAHVIRDMYNIGLLKLGRMPVMEDFDLTLQLLKLGYGNRISCQFAWTQTSNIDGGCSEYRTAEVQADAAHQLAKYHKPFVQIVEKKAKTWQNDLTSRVDVRVAWKKAFEHGLQQLLKGKQHRKAA